MSRTPTRVRAGGVLALSLLAAQVLVGCSEPADPPPARVMLFGDSITQGRPGDWTWRFRLWEHLQDEQERVDLVGPAENLQGNSLDYADPDFDRDHAAVWGAPLTPPPYDPGVLGRVYRPDVVVVELGVNDLLTQQEPPATVASSMVDTIEAFRDASPGVDIVLVHVPVVTIGGVAELNGLYDGLAEQLDTEDERVVVASPEVGFVSDPAAPGTDSYDGLHPNPQGEVKIADAVAAALVEVGIGEED